MRRCLSDRGPRARGYTLMEILVATGILVGLGAGLVTLLRQGIATWTTAERRGRVYEAARALLDRVAEDLRATAIRAHARGADDWVRFIADEGPGGRQRVRFVRAIASETSDTILREGGRLLGVKTPAFYDGKDDAGDASSGLLQAPGGLMEVFYMLDPRPEKTLVWRGARSPPGGSGSLFLDRNVDEPAEVHEPPRPRGAKGKPQEGKTEALPELPPGAEDDAFYMRDFAAPIAEDILHLELRFWAPSTNTWDDLPCLADPRPSQRSGPTWYWDSTRALVDVAGSRDEWGWKPRDGSLADASDDIFPERVEVVVVVREGDDPLGPRLAEDLDDKGASLVLTAEIPLPADPADRFVLVGGEWVAVESAEGNKLAVAANGRGARGTGAARHERGSRVETGAAFRRVVEIPGFRSGVSPSEESPRRPRGGRRP